MRPRISINIREAIYVCRILLVAAIVVALFGVMGVRINFTSSHVPAGLYRARTADRDFAVGDTVIFNIDELYGIYPERADSHTEDFLMSRRLLKRIAALPGAIVERSGDVLIIDGETYPNTAIRGPYDDGNDPCKVTYPHKVADDCVWLMADSRYSYDSRYFGDVPMRIIHAKADAMLFW